MPDAWERIDAAMRRIGEDYRGSFANWLAKHRDEFAAADRTLVETFVKGFQGAPPDRMSAHSLFEATKAEEEQARPVGGYDQMIDLLCRRLVRAGASVRTLCAVDQVGWRSGQVTLRAARETWNARAAVVTVPLGVLKAPRGEAGAIQFGPALREKARLLRQLESGHAIRLALLMRADVWRRGPIPKPLREEKGRAFGFVHSDEAFFPVWWSEAPSPVLVGWTGGEAARKMRGWPGERIFDTACRTLAKLLGCSRAELARTIVDWRTHDWAADVFTRGAYSFSMAGKENAPRELARPVAGTLFFAGEATAGPLEVGTVHGAIASGGRAADEAVAALRPRSR
jgi:monoamine oxidase